MNNVQHNDQSSPAFKRTVVFVIICIISANLIGATSDIFRSFIGPLGHILGAYAIILACISIYCIVAAVVAWATRTDYGYIGILLAAVFYYIRQPMQQVVCGSIVLLSEPPAILAFGPILLYNGKRGRQLKYFFYIFYPLHLLILYGLARLIFFGVH